MDEGLPEGVYAVEPVEPGELDEPIPFVVVPDTVLADDIPMVGYTPAILTLASFLHGQGFLTDEQFAIVKDCLP